MVLPLDRLAEYSEGIERINVEQSIRNKLRILDAIEDCLKQSHKEWLQQAADPESNNLINAKFVSAHEMIANVRQRWQTLLENFDAEASMYLDILLEHEKEKLDQNATLIAALLRHDIVVSYRREVEKPLLQLFWLTCT